MHFFNFHMTEDLKRVCFSGEHRYILFSIAGHADERGEPLYQALCSGDCSAVLGAVAMRYHEHTGRGEDVRAYVVYETEEVREGIELGEQEREAGSN